MIVTTKMIQLTMGGTLFASGWTVIQAATVPEATQTIPQWATLLGIGAMAFLLMQFFKQTSASIQRLQNHSVDKDTFHELRDDLKRGQERQWEEISRLSEQVGKAGGVAAMAEQFRLAITTLRPQSKEGGQ